MERREGSSGDSLEAQLEQMEADRDAIESERMRLELRARLFGDAAVPTQVDRFMVLRRLGSGGMGVVFAATDPQLDREVAIKLLFEGDASDDRRARLLGEAKALAKLSHPNVVAVYEVGEHHGRVFVAMEYVRGRTLMAWVNERPRRWPEILAMYAQAGRGLAAAHGQGIVHRDFKPENVLVGEDERARVLDFGLARSAGLEHQLNASLHTTVASDDSGTRLTRTGARLGTPAYMAPEQFSYADVDERADQFSFCVALWEALYGARPFEGETIEALVAAVVGGRLREPVSAADVPTWVREVVTKGLAVEPSDRWGSMSTLLDALEHDPRQRRQRSIFGTPAAVLVAAAVIAGTAWLTLRPSGSASTDSDRAGTTDAVDIAEDPMPTLARSRQITRLSEDVQITNAEIAPDAKSIAYWATWDGDQRIAVAPSDGGSEVITPRGAVLPASGALRFDPKGFVLSVQKNAAGGVDLVATSPIDAAQRPARSLPGWPESTLIDGASAIAPDGRSIAIESHDRVLVIDTDGHSKAIAASDGTVFDVAWSPDGERLAWIELERGVGPRMVVAASDGAAQHVLMAADALLRPPFAGLTFAGNHHLVYALYEEDAGLWTGTIWERELDDTRFRFADEARPLSEPMPGTPSHLSTSADGRTIAMVKYDLREIVVVAAIGDDGRLGIPERLTIDTSEARPEGWIGDPPRVAYVSRRTGDNVHYSREPGDELATSLFTASSDESYLLHAERDRLLFVDVLPEGAGASIVAVAADGASEVLGRLSAPRAYSAACAGELCTTAGIEDSEIVVRELLRSGVEAQVLARVPHDDGLFMWSLAPDGTRGAILRGDATVEIVSLRGGPVRRLAIAPSADGVSPILQFAAWAADSRSVFVTGMWIEGRLYALVRMDLDGTHEIIHEEANRWMSRPYISPDGTRLTFAARDFSGDAWVLERGPPD